MIPEIRKRRKNIVAKITLKYKVKGSVCYPRDLVFDGDDSDQKLLKNVALVITAYKHIHGFHKVMKLVVGMEPFRGYIV